MGVVTIAYVIYSESLQHEGILGMKWGRRNGPPYPLKDGAHSAAEQKANPSLARRAAKAAAKSISNRVNAYKATHQTRGTWSKRPKHLTDEELARRIKRLKAEQEYITLIGGKTYEARRKARTEAGSAFVKSMMTKLGTRTGSLGTRAGEYGDTLVKDLYSLTKTGGKALGKKISGSWNPEQQAQKYSAKLDAAKKEKAYEDWMLENNQQYIDAMAERMHKQAARASKKEERQYRKDAKELAKIQAKLENYRYDRAKNPSKFAGYKQLQRSDFEAPMYNGTAFANAYVNSIANQIPISVLFDPDNMDG